MKGIARMVCSTERVRNDNFVSDLKNETNVTVNEPR